MNYKRILGAVAGGLWLFAGAMQAVPFNIGQIFASIGNGQVQQYNSAGVLLDTLDAGRGGFTTGSAFDGSGNFYVTNFGANSVSRYTGPGDPHSESLFGGRYSTPEMIVFAQDGNVLVGNTGGGIREFTAGGTFVQTIAAGQRIDFFDLAADQNTIIFGTEGTFIGTASRSTGAVGANFASGLGGNAFGMRFLPGGGVLLANGANVLRLNGAGSIIDTYDVSGVDGFFALNLDPDGTSFISGSFSNGNLYRFNIATGGVDVHTQTIATACGSGCLFGVSMFGEITVGGPGPGTGTVPEPGVLALLAVGLVGATVFRARKH